MKKRLSKALTEQLGMGNYPRLNSMPSAKCPTIPSHHDSGTSRMAWRVQMQEERGEEKRLGLCRTHRDTCLTHNDFLSLDACL